MTTRALLVAILPAIGIYCFAQQTTTSDTDVVLGRPIQSELPKYPKNARKKKIQGTVVLRLTVGRDGAVTHVEPLNGDDALAAEAVRATGKWLYIPYFQGSTPTEVHTVVILNFALNEKGKPEVSARYKEPPPTFATVLKVGNGVTPPRATYAPDPAYSEEARSDKYQGICVLDLVVGPDGKTYDVKVSRAIGDGLDLAAVESVRQWKFEPARKDGQPVAVAIQVEVSFRLY